MRFDCDFLFAALAEKHNAVIRKIREVPPWEWDGEFLKLEPEVLRFLGTFSRRYPECAAFKTAYTLVSLVPGPLPPPSPARSTADPCHQLYTHGRISRVGSGQQSSACAQTADRRLDITNRTRSDIRFVSQSGIRFC